MSLCCCGLDRVIVGHDAEQYAKNCLEYISDKQGWLQLWQCKTCNSYWEMTWEGGSGGFDDGVMTLRYLSLEKVKERWPEVIV